MNATPTEIAHPRPKHTGTKQLFNNPWLERATRTHIAVPVTAFFLYSLILLAWCVLNTSFNYLNISGLFLLGLLTFTLFEYLFHRYFFHMEPTTERRAKLQYKFHGIHHEYPKDKDRLAMPPWLSIAIATTMLWMLHLVIGNASLAFFSGFVLGYALYLLVHYSVHAFQAPKGPLKQLWINHAIHHYKDQNYAFGVSTPLWDYVFSTMGPAATPSKQ
jgi:sterol desaturase/sphingolipid hydroxylase (fatty acid hydroxylase superfamily)